nr:hypothetical protein [Tanacetum cinerariifolium]
NEHGRCDYGGKKKLIFGPGVRGRWKNSRVDGIPEGHERGPAKVRSEALRVVVPTEGVMETGQARVVSSAQTLLKDRLHLMKRLRRSSFSW